MSFLSLQKVHNRLNEMFLLHQEALIGGDLEAAGARLNEFEQELRKHMRDEEELLLPIYERAGKIPGGAVEFFTGEHRKMLEFLARFKATLAQLQASPGTLTRKIIKLFDEEAGFKSLSEHHDMREQNILYPTLDRITTDEEKRALLDQCFTVKKQQPDC